MPSTASGEEQPHAPQHVEKATRQRDTGVQGGHQARCLRGKEEFRKQGPPANSSEAGLFRSTPQGTTCQLHHVSSHTAPCPTATGQPDTARSTEQFVSAKLPWESLSKQIQPDRASNVVTTSRAEQGVILQRLQK